MTNFIWRIVRRRRRREDLNQMMDSSSLGKKEWTVWQACKVPLVPHPTKPSLQA